MRIAQVSPLIESVPPEGYGGTERVVHYLTEELVRQGHDVTLYASGDSVTSARLVAVRPRALRLDPDAGDSLAHHVLLVERVLADARRYDVIHFHLDCLHLPAMRRAPTPFVTTMHGRMDVPGLAALLREYPDVPLISISDAQRAPVPWANWAATIPHGLPMEAITPRLERGGYLAFLGRISPEKRLDRAIEIATRVGYPLRIAAKVDPVDAAYFADEIEPLLAAEGVDYIGEIGDDEKGDFLGGAAALVFPIDWPEPFGLVMVEAMARATPVLAFRRGSVAEVVEDGVTGVIVDTVDEAVAAAPRLLALPRSGVRAAAERRFGVEVMACAHVKLYEQLAPAIGRAAPVEGHAAATSVADLAPVQPIPQITQMPLDDRTPTSRPDESPGRG